MLTIYEIISKKPNDKVPKKLKKILAKYRVGAKFTLDELYMKHPELFENYKSERTARDYIRTYLKEGVKAGVIRMNKSGSVPKEFTELKSVAYWLSQLRDSRMLHGKKMNSTKTQYMLHLWGFNRWLAGKKFEAESIVPTGEDTFVRKKVEREFGSVEELLHVLDHVGSTQKNVVRIIKQYLLDPMHEHKKAVSMTVIMSAILSYFSKNEQPLNVQFDPKVRYATDVQETELSLSDFMVLLTAGNTNVMEKAVFLCKFHRGLDVTTMSDRFNFEAWDQMCEWFGSENPDIWDLEKCPVPISLVRIKTDYMHTGFLERDAVEALQRYLAFREEKTGRKMDSGQAIFLNKFGDPISSAWIMKHFANLAAKSKIQKYTKNRYGKKIYKVRSHELRDLLKSTLIDCGCRPDVADHVIGHKPKDSYEKQAKLYPESMRAEYSKAAGKLNMFTKFARVVSGPDDASEASRRMDEKMREMDRLKKEMLSGMVASQREAEAAHIRMERMQERIDGLGKDPDGMRNGMEFCCVVCSVIHSEKKCPSCGSKLKRIYR